MAAIIIDGKSLAAATRAAQKSAIDSLVARGTRPGLAAVLVGDDPASRVYVRNKARACEETGVRSETHEFPENVSESALMACISRLNADSGVHGILVQLPLPRQLDAGRILATVSPAKDVDGFHAANLGALVQGRPGFVPGTPAGVMRLLEHAGVPLAGRHAVIVGRSTIVGKPLALLLLQKDATVTICHSKTRDLASVTRQADILIVAVGRAKFVTADMVKPGGMRHRCGRESSAGRQARGRRGLRRGEGSGREHHPGTRRRRSDDRRHVDRQHRSSCGAVN